MPARYTCAQEICSPSGRLHNAHQDLAYARMAYSRLLNLTQPGSYHAQALEADSYSTAAAAQQQAERDVWQKMLDGMAPYPEQSSPVGVLPFHLLILRRHL